ncbi:MAG: efflux RND transporter periplasmic adaptor subunit [Pirellulales bacterium]|nr:efflux RND transporter periplasmic adaptor subunit [Pirellulales bacterium]
MNQVTVNHPTSRPLDGEENCREQPPQAETPPPRRGFMLMNRAIGQFPTVLVIVALAGIGFYGHCSAWKLPKFSTMTGGGAGLPDEWCEEHGVPESQCVECRPSLLPRGKDYGWCKEHGVHDCPLCHPEAAQLKQTTEGIEADRARAARALASAPGPENNAVCKNYRRRIQFATQEAVRKAGVEVELVARRPLVDSVSANGEITYDQTRFANLASRLPGTVWSVEKNVGDRVRKGEVLALIETAEVGRAKTELIQALAEENLLRKIVNRLLPASSDGVVSGRQLEKAQADLVLAQARSMNAQQALVNLGLPVDIEALRALPEQNFAQHLRLLGLPKPLAARFDDAETTSNLLPLKAPMDGIVVNRHAVAGEVVDTARIAFELADTSRMWLTLNVPPEDADKLALGQPVQFRPDGSRVEVGGTLVWISTTADQHTRMVAVRAELSNPGGLLRNQTFGTGRIVLREEREAITVPNEAIHGDGCCRIAFVRDKSYFDKPESLKVFHVRTVRVGIRGKNYSEVIAGLLPGEVVAAKGSDALRAELLKNNLGEGCCAAE